MKKFVLLSLFALMCSNLLAQTADELHKIDPLYIYELYRPYPVEQIGEFSKPPKGYKPFYISHLARHGSRYHASSDLYDRMLDLFSRADKADALTDTGKRFLKDWSLMSERAKGRAGELSALGAEQHRGVARRMVETYPEVFKSRTGRGAHIDCRSTIVPRCILSMTAATNTISSLLPEVDIRVESSEANTYLKAYAGLNSVKATSVPYSDSLRRAYMPSTEAFINRLFTDKGAIVAKEQSGCDFMYDMFLATAILGSTPTAEVPSFEYLFSREELAAVWRASNIRRYALTGPSRRFHKIIMGGIAPLVRNIIATADRAIETGDEQATLRFAHDVTVIPLVAALGIECGNVVSDDYDNVSHRWQCSTVTPMGATIQIVFYRNKAGNVLVKVLHNEREQLLDKAVGEPVEGVYYRWSDLRRHLQKTAEINLNAGGSNSTNLQPMLGI